MTLHLVTPREDDVDAPLVPEPDTGACARCGALVGVYLYGECDTPRWHPAAFTPSGAVCADCYDS